MGNQCGRDPAFRNAWLAQTATTSGFRECREIKALHRVTAAAFASMRVQAQCMAMGQAAGTLAAFMPGKDMRQLDFVAVRRLCERQGAITK
jgi:hypothetical protein